MLMTNLMSKIMYHPVRSISCSWIFMHFPGPFWLKRSPPRSFSTGAHGAGYPDPCRRRAAPPRPGCGSRRPLARRLTASSCSSWSPRAPPACRPPSALPPVAAGGASASPSSALSAPTGEEPSLATILSGAEPTGPSRLPFH